MVDKLNYIKDNCKAAITLYINEHKNDYSTVEQWIKDKKMILEDDDILEDPIILQKCIETDTLIELYFYPDTPIGSYDLIDYDIDRILDRAIKILNNDNRQ